MWNPCTSSASRGGADGCGEAAVGLEPTPLNPKPAARIDRLCQTLVHECLDLVRRMAAAYYLSIAAVEPIRDAFLRAIRGGVADSEDPSDLPAPALTSPKRPRIEQHNMIVNRLFMLA